MTYANEMKSRAQILGSLQKVPTGVKLTGNGCFRHFLQKMADFSKMRGERLEGCMGFRDLLRFFWMKGTGYFQVSLTPRAIQYSGVWGTGGGGSEQADKLTFPTTKLVKTA